MPSPQNVQKFFPKVFEKSLILRRGDAPESFEPLDFKQLLRVLVQIQQRVSCTYLKRVRLLGIIMLPRCFLSLIVPCHPAENKYTQRVALFLCDVCQNPVVSIRKWLRTLFLFYITASSNIEMSNAQWDLTAAVEMCGPLAATAVGLICVGESRRADSLPRRFSTSDNERTRSSVREDTPDTHAQAAGQRRLMVSHVWVTRSVCVIMIL